MPTPGVSTRSSGTRSRRLFTADAVAAYSRWRLTFEGRDAIVDFLSGRWRRDVPFDHRCTTEIDLTGPDTATGVWALDDTVIDTQWDITIRGASFYADEYVKQDGRWKIRRTSYKRSSRSCSPAATSRA